MLELGYFTQIIYATKVTLGVSLLALIIGLVFGLISAFLERSIFPISFILKCWNLIVRSLPEIIIIFIFYFGLSSFIEIVTGLQISVNAFLSAAIALSLVFSAYASQIFIAARNSIDSGEIDSAKSLGLSKIDIFKSIILPELWRHAFPGLTNLWLILLKDSSIISVVGITDIMRASQTAASQTYSPILFYSFAGLLYLILCSISLLVCKYLNNKIHHGNKHARISL